STASHPWLPRPSPRPRRRPGAKTLTPRPGETPPRRTQRMVGPGRCSNTTPGPNPQPNPKPRPPSRRVMRAVNSLTECRKTQSLHADVLSESDDLYARLADLADATGDPRLLRLAHDIAAITAELARRDDLGDVLAGMPG